MCVFAVVKWKSLICLVLVLKYMLVIEKSRPLKTDYISLLKNVIICRFLPLYDIAFLQYYSALPACRHHLINDGCLEDKREDYQNCSVLYCSDSDSD